MTSFLIIDDHPLFRDALGNAIRLAHTDARILEAMSTFGSRGWAQIMSAKGPGRVKTFFLPQKLHAAGRNPRRRDRLSLFLLYRVRSQSGRNLGPRRTT